MTTDDTIMTDIVTKKNDFVNNKTAMEEMAKTDYRSAVLGGQNPLPIYLQGVGTIDASNMSAYDQAYLIAGRQISQKGLLESAESLQKVFLRDLHTP